MRSVFFRATVLAAGVAAFTAGLSAATFTVTNTGDSGAGSLRQAILDANAHAGADVVRFATGLHGTISLSGELGVTDDLTVTGPGAVGGRFTVSGAVAKVNSPENALLPEASADLIVAK